MAIKACFSFAAPLLFLALPSLASPGIIGEARSLEGGELQYSEHHFCTQDQRACRVEYRDQAGEMFARKLVDYSTGFHSPMLELQDYRLGETRTLQGGYDREVVVDAGFDHYVRQRWEELAAGEEIRFPFLIAGRDKPLRMAARRDDERNCGDDRLCLVVTLDMWLVALLVEPIRLVYDDSRRLAQFRGVSNIPTAEGKSQSVEINYRYLADSAGHRAQ